MAPPSPSSSSSPSSSAVTLPRPGKSILKKPPPPQQSFFSLSRLSRLLPTQLPSPSGPNPSGADAAGDANLKRAHFFLPHLVTVYPISAANPPCSLNTKEEKRSVEAREAERRRRIVRGNSFGPGSSETEEWWSMDKVESFYRECCAGREEQPHAGISAALKRASGSNGRALDLSGVQLSMGQATTLSDVLAVEWGLRKLFLKECDLDDLILKPILHALLIPGTLNFLSVASNRRLKAPAFKLVGAFARKCKNLQFLDLSQNVLDKKSVEYIGASLSPANEAGLVSLRLDDCSLRPTALEALAQAVRTSSLRNVSLRHNRISASGAVALALMIKDYPDTMPVYSAPSSLSSPTSTGASSLFGTLSPPATPTTASPPLTPTRQPTALPPLVNSNAAPPSPRSAFSKLAPPPRHAGPLPPPPVHPANAPMQTTYTPYIPRARRGAGITSGAPAAGAATATMKAVQHAAHAPNPLGAGGKPVPVITSSAQGGVTTRHPVPPVPLSPVPSSIQREPSHTQGPSAALLDKVRALDALPRLGELRTLDLRGNDIRNGIQYVAQVLKRNRTLKVLNLSENKIDVQGLVAVAESLKYNLNLETLDLSRNPCSGPSLEGIQSLRTAFTLNTSLKRLFLSSTSLTSTGAIALAEFLPESTSLLHLDLTLNNLGLAGLMALSGGLKANHTMRCLDLNIPPDDEEFARICRDILNTCVRNTEEAEKGSLGAGSGRGLGKGVWGMIEESELAKTFKKDEEKKADGDTVNQAKKCQTELHELLLRLSSVSNGHSSDNDADNDADSELIGRSKAILVVFTDAIQATTDPVTIEELFLLNDSITALLSEIDGVRKGAVRTGSGLPILTSLQASGGTSLDYEDQAEAEDSSQRDFQGPGAIVKDAKPNGGLMLHIPSKDGDVEGEDVDAMTPETPRIDKGKRRAEPEPEVHEKVLSPSFMISGSDDEDEEGKLAFVGEPGEDDEGPTPTDLSKVMVEEEGEVFRKSNVLLGPEEMEGEYDGEELRIELLEAQVERPPPRSLVEDEFGMELPPLPMSPPVDAGEKILSPTTLQEPPKIAPLPYLRRSRSSSSSTLQGGQSPTVGGPGQEDSMVNGMQSPDVLSPTTPLSPVQEQAGLMPYLPRRRSSSNNTSPVL